VAVTAGRVKRRGQRLAGTDLPGDGRSPPDACPHAAEGSVHRENPAAAAFLCKMNANPVRLHAARENGPDTAALRNAG